MDEAVANARASLGCDQSFDVDASKEFHVRQKYMGHRNARYDYLFYIKLFFIFISIQETSNRLQSIFDTTLSALSHKKIKLRQNYISV